MGPRSRLDDVPAPPPTPPISLPKMELRSLIEGLPLRLLRGGGGSMIASIVDDSRRADAGSLFVARAGTQADGAGYICDAIGRGAAAVLAAPASHVPASFTGAVLVADDPARMGVELANRLHDRPADKLHMIGITGTNGKTTTAYMVRHLLNTMGSKCGLIGTVEIDDGGARPQAAELTTPGALDLIALLARMVAHGCDACVMEVSSHALDQNRVDPAMFDVAVFTNLTGDHLDYHKTMEAYFAAKRKLFIGLREKAAAVINADDPWGAKLIAEREGNTFGFNVGRSAEGSLWSAQILEATAAGTRLRLDSFDDASIELTLPLIGRHNVYNLLGAFGVASLQGHSTETLRASIESMPCVPGRLERVGDADVPFAVFVDYAHTDDALANVLRAMRPITMGRLRVLFGCGGDRDKSKRPRMAKVACELADDVVITSDNPRTEDPAAIIADIVAGVPAPKRDSVIVESDRRAAIERIIDSAEPGDTILIAGKGHEDYQIIGTTKHHFDDREEAAKALARFASCPSPTGGGRVGESPHTARPRSQSGAIGGSSVPSSNPARGEGGRT